MIYVAAIIMWLAIGAVVGLIEARRGFWRKTWVVDAVLGPLAIPLAIQRRRPTVTGPGIADRGRARRGRIDVLVGVDGSAESAAAARAAAGLLGPRVHRFTLATVLDYDTATPHANSGLFAEPWPEETAARAALDRIASEVRVESGTEPRTVLLAGEPAVALARFAQDEGYQMIAVGRRGRGLSKLLVGSCATKLQRAATVPVLLGGPAQRRTELDAPTAGVASR